MRLLVFLNDKWLVLVKKYDIVGKSNNITRYVNA